MNRLSLFVDIRNSAVIQVITTFVIYLQVPLLIRLLSAEKYGLWTTIVSTVIVVGNLDLGIANTLKNQIAESFSLENKAKFFLNYQEGFLRHLMYSGIYLGCSVIIMIILRASIDSVSNEIMFITLIVIFGWCVDYVFKSVLLAYSAQQKNYVMQISQLVINIIYLVLTISFSDKVTLKQFALIFSAIAPFVNGIIFMRFLYLNKDNLTHWKDIHLKSLTGNLKFMHVQIGMLLLLNLGYLLTLNLTGGVEVTGLSIVEKYFGLISLFANVILFPMWSKFSELHVKREFEKIKQYIHKIERVLKLIFIALVVMICAFSYAKNIWIGQSVEIRLLTVVIVALRHFFQVGNSVYCYYLNAVGDLNLQVMLYYLFGILNVPISLILFRIFGFNGIILWPAISMIIMTIMTRKNVNRILLLG